MKKALILVAGLLLVTACHSAPTPSQTPVSFDAFQTNARLGRGVNLGNALEAPNEGEWGVTLQEEYFQLIKDKGFNSVRIPIRWSAHALPTAPYTLYSSFLQRVDWAVNQALSRNLLVVINMHNYDEINKDPDGNRERFLGIWKQIAEHYKDYSANLLFEPLNEPNTSLTASKWNDLIAAVLPVIRASNPNRNVVIGPVDWYSLSRLQDLELPKEDQHIIVSFHYYLPLHFTHQGAEWMAGSQAWLGTVWKGTSNDKSSITYDFDRVQQWAKDENRPIYLGEFGAYSKADMDSRALWTAFVARSAESHGFSWSYWEFCAGFGIYDPTIKTWHNQLLTALIPGQ